MKNPIRTFQPVTAILRRIGLRPVTRFVIQTPLDRPEAYPTGVPFTAIKGAWTFQSATLNRNGARAAVRLRTFQPAK